MRLLILAGTHEARMLIKALAPLGLGKIIVSYREQPRLSCAHRDIELRIGGFGGDKGFEAFLHKHAITAVLDATHPFAAKISTRTAKICHERAIAHLKILRPAWHAVAGDKWISVSCIERARAKIPPEAIVFFAAGRQQLEKFGDIGKKIFCRQLSPPEAPFPYAGGAFLHSPVPAFSCDDEIALFKRLGITHIISKNAGGSASYAKIEAARLCTLPVIMVARPPLIQGIEIVDNVEEALRWVKSRAQLGAL